MEPKQVLSVDEIKLSDLDFWQRPWDEREGAFLTLREERPISFHEENEVEILPKGPGYWALTLHQDVVHASRNPEIFCSGQGTNINDLPAPFQEFFGSMINMDDPRHGRLRRIVSRGFTPRMIAKAELEVTRAATKIIDDVIEKGECDFVSEIAAKLPLKIICDMMGIPESQYDMVFEKSNLILGAGDPDFVTDINLIIPQLLMAGAELANLMKDLAKFRRKTPSDDLTSALVNTEIDGETLDDQEMGSFFVLLTVAGNETTRNAISHGMKALCDYPAERAKWQADFNGVAPTAIEEIVRWSTPVIHFRRTATRDVELRGQQIRKGEKVVLWYNSANRDPAVFDEPYRFDLTRDPNEHVGFGGPGPHHCVGAHLARREMTIMFREIFDRIPDLEITSEPDRLQSFFIHGIKRMPCAFSPGRPSKAA